MGDTGKGERHFLQERAPGAVFFDIDRVADQDSVLPHMLPSPAQFAEHMTALGVSAADQIIVYNQPECVSAARCWWTFKALRHPQPVYVLDGGASDAVCLMSDV
jgi:thiosulfate/3-mercaptopyruvate sulfurtransferase